MILKRALSATILLLSCFALLSQGTDVADSLRPYVVTATMNPSRQDEVPARVTVITAEGIAVASVTNTDELLVAVPGVFVNRSWGIFSKNSSVTMRGLSGSARVLVLLDGIPLNRAGGGGINWHLIHPEQLSHIEVLNGPASAIYGQNAMGGVIQLFTRKPSGKPNFGAGVDWGSFNTFSGNAAGGMISKDGRYYVTAGGAYRQGDGYLLTPEEARTPYDTTAFLKEAQFHMTSGMQPKAGHNLTINLVMQSDLRGAGIKVYEPDGAVFRSFTHFVSAGYTVKIAGRSHFSAKIFNQNEQQDGVDEKVNQQGVYKLMDTETRMNETGAMFHFTHQTGRHQLMTGMDTRFGRLNNIDLYRTSTDRLEAGGVITVHGLFVQDDISLIGEKLTAVAGVRLDHASFRKGYLNVIDPSKETGFADNLNDRFKENQWSALSPRIALQYRPWKVARFYVSAGRGFSAPKLNDMTSSGKIRKGFKLANPELGPEVIDNYEVGSTLSLLPWLTATPSLFHSMAKSMQYQVSTGDSMDVSGELKPVLQVRNIAGVKITGGEMRLDGRIGAGLGAYASYSYSLSLLHSAGTTDPLVQNLDGKYLSEVPMHLASGGVSMIRARWFGRVDWTYTGTLWYDDENTIQTDDYHIFNLKTGYRFTPRWLLTITIQDLFDNVHTDKKGLLSPGRYLMAGLRYGIAQNR